MNRSQDKIIQFFYIPSIVKGHGERFVAPLVKRTEVYSAGKID